MTEKYGKAPRMHPLRISVHSVGCPSAVGCLLSLWVSVLLSAFDGLIYFDIILISYIFITYYVSRYCTTV